MDGLIPKSNRMEGVNALVSSTLSGERKCSLAIILRKEGAMRLYAATAGMVFLAMWVVGCDSGQYGQESKTQPQAQGESMTQQKEQSASVATADGALLAPEDAAGAKENNEGVEHYQQGHWDVARDHFQKALAANANLPEAHYNLGLALDKLGEHSEAATHFKMALDLAPEDPRIKDSAILQAHVGG
ncbi:MAG: tetratricopeptide repeat protein [Nitrospirae bacterium]|nr:MAG: tetratricopeptide repeat protein [Nitrospirota bacterium]